jgi:hypothetical protein
MDNNKIQKRIAYVLLTPAMLSVMAFIFLQVLLFIELFHPIDMYSWLINDFTRHLTLLYNGDEYYGSVGSPIYVGLMAIAGVYLLVNTKKE